jgi:DTW domain
MGTMMRKQLEDMVVDKSQLVLEEEKLKSDYTLDNLPIKKAVFIDSTWSQCRSIYQDPKVNSIRPVVLQNRITQFWRPQKGSPRWYLSTIEAIHQFLLEVHTSAWGMNTNYRGLDNLEVDLPFLSPSKLINHPSDVRNGDLAVPYDGQYDNMLFFFIHMYEIIHDRYDHDQKLAYKRPLV